jgi:hypothetical protein
MLRPLLSVKQHNKLHMCVDYCELNDITSKDKNPFPLIQDIYDTLSEVTVFSKLDLPNTYHLIQIKEGDKWMTAIKTPFASVFQCFMNYVLQDLIGKCCMVYLDDIIVFSRNQTEHEEHLCAILDKLRENLLHINPAKCQFFRSSITFLGHIICHRSIQIVMN